MRREKKEERETKREGERKGNNGDRQVCDSVFSACAAFPPVRTSPVRPTGAGTSRIGTSRIKCGRRRSVSGK